MRPYEGLLTAMITPFKGEGGGVDEEAAVAMGRHLLASGSDGLVVAGTTGEAATMTDTEQTELVRLIVSECGGQGNIVAGAGSNDTRHGCHLTEMVIEAGAQAVLSVTPYYNKPNRRGIRRHFEEIARAAGDTPVILYNIPGRTVVNMPPELLAELAEIDNIVAVKQSNNDEAQLIEGLALLAGNDELLAPVLDMGGAGGICVSSHVAGPEMKRMFTEPDRRAEIQDRLSKLFEVLFITASPAPVKAALEMLGHNAGAMRLPMVECDEDEKAQIRAELERLGLLQRAPAA